MNNKQHLLIAFIGVFLTAGMNFTSTLAFVKDVSPDRKGGEASVVQVEHWQFTVVWDVA